MYDPFIHEMINKLIYDVIDISDNTEYCCICLDKLHQIPTITLSCGHLLHLSCLKTLLQHTNKCPLCKQYILHINHNNQIHMMYNNYVNVDVREVTILDALQECVKNIFTCLTITICCFGPSLTIFYFCIPAIV